MAELFECLFKGLFGCIPVLCEFLCQNLGPLLSSIAECMFQCVSVGCVQLISTLCTCWCRSAWWGYGSRKDTFDGCFYIILFLILSSIVIGTLALGIYALSQYVQDFNPTVAAGIACAVLNEQLTGPSFSALPVTFGRSKGLNIVAAPTLSPITVINRCFNENRGSAKFYVDGRYVAYTKIDKKLYSCNGSVTHQLEFGSTLRVLNADNSLLASTDKVPTTVSSTTFKDTNNVDVATLLPSASGSGFDIQILAAGSGNPAAAPLLLLAVAAFAQFSSTGYDECNGFVLAGGIVDLILLSILFVFSLYMTVQWFRKRDRLSATRFYDPDVVVDAPPLSPPPSTLTPVASQYAYAGAHPIDYQDFSSQPQRAVIKDTTSLLFQEEHDFSKSSERVQQLTLPHSPPFATSAMPTVPQQLQFQSTPDHIDLRKALEPVGYTRLKRYLTSHNVTVGHTLLKDELVTLAVIYRRQIDFSPLIAEVSNM
jgi:hypothetical protein